MARAGKSKQKKGPLVQKVEYSLYRFVRSALRHTDDAGLHRWSDRISRFSYRLLRSRTNVARRNLELVFPEKSAAEREEIVRACWNHFSKMTLEYIRDSGKNFDEADTTGVDAERLDQAMARGKSVLVISAHFGSWESGVGYLGRFPLPVTVIGRGLDNELLQMELSRGRTRSGFQLLDRRGAARDVVRAVQQPGFVVMLSDQAAKPREAILVPFLGLPAWTTPAPAKLAIKYGVPILPVFAYPGQPVRIEFLPPIFVDELSEEARTEEAITRHLNDIMSDRIRRDPHLWLWFHDRWKRAPRS